MTHWQTLSSEIVYKTHWMTVRRDEVISPTNQALTYSVVDVRPSVYILALNKKGEVFTITNYRYSLNKKLVALPAGFCDDTDLDPLTSAKRELMEETGLASDDWVDLGKLYQATGIARIPSTCFMARSVYVAKGERDSNEPISEGKFRSWAEIEDLVRQQQIEDTSMIAALYLAKLHGL